MNFPAYVLRNSCEHSLEECLRDNFPQATVSANGEYIVVDGMEHSVYRVDVVNLDEISNCLELYKIDIE